MEPPTILPEPYFVVPGGEGLRRALLLAYHFPPAQTAGSLRWQKMVRFAYERGWSFDVITRDPRQLTGSDPARLQELPPGTRIFALAQRASTLAHIENGAWKMLRAVRERLRPRRDNPAESTGRTPASGFTHASTRPSSFRRDEVRWARSFRDLLRAYYASLQYMEELSWARDASLLADSIVRDVTHAVVISSGPPHMVHEGGRRIAQRHGIPHVMDMRDPWSLTERLLEDVGSPLWLRLASHFESRIVRQAALVVTNTEPARRAMATAYPFAAERIVTVMNGFDDDPLPPRPSRGRFTVAYAGTIYLDRDPGPLFEAAARFVRQSGATPDDFGLEFVGNVETFGSESMERLAQRAGIGAFVRVHATIPRRRLLEFLSSASMVVILPQDSTMAVPSKVFEYMPYAAWVLALVDRGSATDLVLRETRADVVLRDDVEGIARALRTRYEEHRCGIVPLPIAEDRFSRRAQAQRLLEAMERFVRQ